MRRAPTMVHRSTTLAEPPTRAAPHIMVSRTAVSRAAKAAAVADPETRPEATRRLRFAVEHSSLGQLLVAETDRSVCALFLGDAPGPLVNELRRRFPRACLEEGLAADGNPLAGALELVASPGRPPAWPLALRGTPFQLRVWSALREIPAGTTRSYKEVARSIGAQGAARAVAGACAANPVALAVPCHRVVRQDGSLSGYRWGLERKRNLLERERAQLGRS